MTGAIRAPKKMPKFSPVNVSLPPLNARILTPLVYHNLRISDIDVFIAETAENLVTDVAARLPAAPNVGNIETQLKVQRRFAEILEQDVRRRHPHNFFTTARTLKQQARYLVGVRVVGYSDQHALTLPVIAVREIGQRGGNQRRIRNNHAGFVKRFHLGGADIDLLDFAFFAADKHPVADFKRPLKQKDNAADQILDNVLQAETDTDGKRTGDNREVGKVNSHRHNRQNGGNDNAGKAETGNQRMADTLVHIDTVQQIVRQAFFHHPH